MTRVWLFLTPAAYCFRISYPTTCSGDSSTIPEKYWAKLSRLCLATMDFHLIDPCLYCAFTILSYGISDVNYTDAKPFIRRRNSQEVQHHCAGMWLSKCYRTEFPLFTARIVNAERQWRVRRILFHKHLDGHFFTFPAYLHAKEVLLFPAQSTLIQVFTSCSLLLNSKCLLVGEGGQESPRTTPHLDQMTQCCFRILSNKHWRATWGYCMTMRTTTTTPTTCSCILMVRDL